MTEVKKVIAKKPRKEAKAKEEQVTLVEVVEAAEEAVAPVKRQEATKGLAEVIDISPEPTADATPPSQVEVAEEHADRKKEAKVRQRTVRDIVEKETELWVELAEQLYEIQSKGLFHMMTNPTTNQKYPSFQAFAQNELGHSERTANYFIEIWKKIVIEHSRELLEEIKHLGWSKCKELSGFLDPENKVEVLSLVEGAQDVPAMSVKDVRNFVRESQTAAAKKDKSPASKKDPADSKTGKDVKQEHPKKVSFAMFDAQSENLTMAINTAKKVRGTDSDSEALEIMALDFQSHHVDASTDSKIGIIKNVESALESKVILLNQKDGVGFFSGGKLASTKDGRVSELFELLEAEIGCDIIAFKDDTITYSGISDDDTALSSFLMHIEKILGVQLLAVMEGADGPSSVYANPALEQFFIEEDGE